MSSPAKSLSSGSNLQTSYSVIALVVSLGAVLLRTTVAPVPALAQAIERDAAVAEDRCQLTIEVTDADGRLLPCRVHVRDESGMPVRADGLPFWRDHFVCDGKAGLDLPYGRYSIDVERGPEHERHLGEIDCRTAQHRLRVRLARIADLASEGWFSGDLHVHRAVEDVPLLMRAEDLHVAPVITWWNNRNLWNDRQLPEESTTRFDGDRFYDVLAGEDEREGGALLYVHLARPLDIAGASREHPSPMKYVTEARRHEGAWIDIEKPFWWDVPIWLASGEVDSIGLANNHMCRSQMYETEAWGRPRDAGRLPAPRGNGYWTQEIYYHVLNAGLRLPPSAGSASGVLPNPVGYNRVYVHTGRDWSYADWWQGLKAGRSFVTNGPLLVCRADGQLPGHVFRSDNGSPVRVTLTGRLIALDRVPQMEIIKNGRVERAVDVPDTGFEGELATLTFEESGWFLVRAIAENPRTFRFASTAPFYVEVGDSRRRISRGSAQFFLDWTEERIERVPAKLDDPEKLRDVLVWHEQAREFWRKTLEQANAK